MSKRCWIHPEAAADAKNRRERKAKGRPAIRWNTADPRWLATMTHEALKDDAPASLLIALCQYMGKTTDV